MHGIIAHRASPAMSLSAQRCQFAKVRNGTLTAADFASGVLPVSVDAFACFLNGPIAIPITSTWLATLPIPQAGN